MTKKIELDNEENLELDNKKEEDNSSNKTNYVDPNDELLANLVKEKIDGGSIKVSKEELFDDEEITEDSDTEITEELEVEQEEVLEKKEEKTELNSEIEQLRKERAELLALKEELEKTKQILLAKEEEKKTEETKIEVSKAKSLKKEEKAKKLESGLMKILEGEVDAIEELKEALLAEEDSTDIETLVSKKAEEIANKKIQDYEQQKQFIEFNNSFIAKNQELKNDAFMHIFNDQLSRIAGSTEGSGLTLDGLYNKALENSKVFAAKLGFNQIPQDSVDDDDSEMKAKLEKAKAASVTDTSAVSKSSTKRKESDRAVTDKFLFKSFFENFNS